MSMLMNCGVGQMDTVVSAECVHCGLAGLFVMKPGQAPRCEDGCEYCNCASCAEMRKDR